MDVRPLSPAVGAEVTGVRLGDQLSEATIDELFAAFHEHCVLVFPGQHLDPERQQAFAAGGAPLVVPYLAAHAVPGTPAVLRVPNMGKAETLTENWHFDSAYFEHPPPIAILAAQELPAVGGDTMWANQYLAYEALSPAMQALLSNLRAAFTGTMPDDDGVRREVVTYHPVVRTHPVDQAPIAGDRADRVGAALRRHDRRGEPTGLRVPLPTTSSRPSSSDRHRWRDGDVVMWDNRCLLHYAVHRLWRRHTADAPRHRRRSVRRAEPS